MPMSLLEGVCRSMRVASRSERSSAHGVPARRSRMLALAVVIVPALGSVATAGIVTPFTAVGSVTNAVTGQSGTITYNGSFEQTYLGFIGGKDTYSYTFASSVSENVVVPEWVIKAITAKLIADTTPFQPASPPPPFPPPPSPPRSVATLTGSDFTGTFAATASAMTMSGSLTVTPALVSIAYTSTFTSAIPSFTGALAGSFTANGTLQPKPAGVTGATETTALMLSTSPMVLSIQDVLPVDLSIDLSWDPSYGTFAYSQTIDAAFNLTEAVGSWTATGTVDITSVPEIDGASTGSVIGMVGAALLLLRGHKPARRRNVAKFAAA